MHFTFTTVGDIVSQHFSEWPWPLLLEFRTGSNSVRLNGSYVQVLRLCRVLENENVVVWDSGKTNCEDGEFHSMDLKLRKDFNFASIERVLGCEGYAGHGCYDYMGADFKCVFVGALDSFVAKRRGNECFFIPL